MRIFIFTVFVILSQTLRAQITPCFTATQTRGCAPFTVQINDCSTGSTDNDPKPTYDYGNGFFVIDVTHTYTQPGKYTIRQLVSVGNGTGTNILPKVDYIEVLPTPVPQFQVTRCEGGKVTITVEDYTYDDYSIDPGDGTPAVTVGKGGSYNHIYTDLNPKTITVTGNYNPNLCNVPAQKTVIPYNALPVPELTSLRVLQEAAVELTFPVNSTYNYRVLEKINTGTYQVIDQISNSSGNQTRKYSGRDPKNNSYSFILEVYDDCAIEIESEELSTISTSISTANKEVNVNWNSLGSFSTYEVTRNQTTVTNLPAGNTFYQDSDILCNNEYCYIIQGNKTVNGKILSSFSAEECVTGLSTDTPPTLAYLNSTVINGNIVLDFPQAPVPVEAYTIYTSESGAFSESEKTTEPVYQTVQDLSRQTCFKVNYQDLCKNISDYTAITCPVYLKVEREGSRNMVEWTLYQGELPSYNVNLEILDQNQNLLASIPVNNKYMYRDSDYSSYSRVYYRIKVTDPNDFVSYSNLVELKNELILLIPDAFTPNDDGVNDVFKPEAQFIETYNLSIYNNWGELIFTTTDLDQGWDGKYNGVPLVTGSYAYLIETIDKDGKKHIRSGTVTLIK